MGLGKWSKDLRFKIFYEILCLLDFEFAARALLRLRSFFPRQLVLLMVVREKKYMKLDVGKVVDHMTQGSCIPTDSVKSEDDCSSPFYNVRTGTYIDSDKINLTYLVGYSYEIPGW